MSKWEKGQSGNAQGARLHKGPSVRSRLRTMFLDEALDVMAVIVERAKAGDPFALKLFADRVYPTLRPTAEQIELDIPTQATLMQRAEAVLALAAAGEIPLDTASEFITNATKLVAIEQAGELKAQLELLMADHWKDIA